MRQSLSRWTSKSATPAPDPAAPGLLPAPGGPARLPGLALLGVVILTLAVELGAPRDLAWGTALLLTTYTLALWPRIGAVPRAFAVIALGLGALGLAAGGLERIDLREAFFRAGFIGSLFAAFGVLREAAATSATVRRCGLFLARRPPGWRYGALTTGSQTFGLILNFGVIPLLGAMVTEGTKAADTAPANGASNAAPDQARRDAIRRLRMAKAIHRGFAAVLAWSPLTVSLAVILTALPDLTWEALAPYLIPYVLAFLILGWTLDRLSPIRRKAPPPPATPEAEDGSWALTLPIVLLVAGILLGGWLVGRMLDLRLVAAVMLLAPGLAAGWILVQRLPQEPPAAALEHVGARLATHVRDTFPAYRTELLVVGASAFIGVVVAALLPPGLIPRLLETLDWPAWVLPLAVPWLAVIGGQAGMSPVLSISLIAATMPTPALLGLPAPVMATAYAGSWALVAASSPSTAAVIASARVARSALMPMTPWRFGLEQNGLFTLLATLALTAYLGGLIWLGGG